eukprot:gene9893-biopygen3252
MAMDLPIHKTTNAQHMLQTTQYSLTCPQKLTYSHPCGIVLRGGILRPRRHIPCHFLLYSGACGAADPQPLGPAALHFTPSSPSLEGAVKTTMPVDQRVLRWRRSVRCCISFSNENRWIDDLETTAMQRPNALVAAWMNRGGSMSHDYDLRMASQYSKTSYGVCAH